MRDKELMDLPHHVSKVHPQMLRKNRAAQFAPFAALTGYEEAVREAEHFMNDKMISDEHEKAQTDWKFKEVRDADVICQHNQDGTIIPLKVRIRDDDGEPQIYSVKSYKELSTNGTFRLPNGDGFSGRHLWAFECQIQIFDLRKRIRLFYNAMDGCWKALFLG